MKRKKRRQRERGGRGRLRKTTEGRKSQTVRWFRWELSDLAASGLSVVVPLIWVAASEDTRPYKTQILPRQLHLQTSSSLLLQAGLSSSADSTPHLTVFSHHVCNPGPFSTLYYILSSHQPHSLIPPLQEKTSSSTPENLQTRLIFFSLLSSKMELGSTIHTKELI